MTNMYQVIENLCEKKGTNVTAMCRETGISRSVMSELKSGRTQTLSAANTEKVAKYFGVSVGVVMGENAPGVPDEAMPEIMEYLEQLKTRQEMRTLFRLAQGATKEDVEKAVKIIEALKK